MADNERGLKILRPRETAKKTGLGFSTMCAKYSRNPRRPSDYDPTFPTPIKLGARSVGFVEREVDAWIEAQIEKSRSGSPRNSRLNTEADDQ